MRGAKSLAVGLTVLAGTTAGFAQTNANDATPVIRIQADQVKATVSPLLYGLMTEEINYSYEGGLYAELIRNRSFKANPTNVVFLEPGGRCRHQSGPRHGFERRA